MAVECEPHLNTDPVVDHSGKSPELAYLLCKGFDHTDRGDPFCRVTVQGGVQSALSHTRGSDLGSEGIEDIGIQGKGKKDEQGDPPVEIREHTDSHENPHRLRHHVDGLGCAPSLDYFDVTQHATHDPARGHVLKETDMQSLQLLVQIAPEPVDELLACPYNEPASEPMTDNEDCPNPGQNTEPDPKKLELMSQILRGDGRAYLQHIVYEKTCRQDSGKGLSAPEKGHEGG